MKKAEKEIYYHEIETIYRINVRYYIISKETDMEEMRKHLEDTFYIDGVTKEISSEILEQEMKHGVFNGENFDMYYKVDGKRCIVNIAYGDFYMYDTIPHECLHTMQRIYKIINSHTEIQELEEQDAYFLGHLCREFYIALEKYENLNREEKCH